MYIRRNVRRNGEKVSVTYSVVESYRDEAGQVRQRTITGLGKHTTVESKLAELHDEFQRASDSSMAFLATVIPRMEIARLEPIARSRVRASAAGGADAGHDLYRQGSS